MTTIDRANTFTQVKRGYDQEEVERHLNDLRRSFSAELESERQRVRELEGELATAKQREEAIHLTLVAATKTRDEMLAAAQLKLDEAAATARSEAETILKEAKYEAFRLVTEAREDSDRLIADAKQRAEAVPAATGEAERIIGAAEEKARELLAEVEHTRATMLSEAESARSSVLAEARSQAMSILTGAQDDADVISSEQDRTVAERRDHLQAEVARLEAHAESLRSEVARLEAAAAAAPAPPPRSDGDDDGSGVSSRFAAEMVEATHRREAERSEVTASAVVEEPAAEVTHQPEPEPAVVPERVPEPVAAGARGSFYSRRSANLPHLGEESGRNALAAMNGLRGHIRNANIAIEEDADEAERRGPTPDLAVQSA